MTQVTLNELHDPTPWIVNPGFLEAMSQNGVSNVEAIQELIDNSIDAKATRIDIHLEQEKQGEPVEICVVDNGTGMPEGVLQRCLYFGQTVQEEGVSRIGKFGVGLALAALSMTRRVDVYSRVGEDWYWTYIDRDEVDADPDHWVPPAPVINNDADAVTSYGRDDSRTIILFSRSQIESARARTLETDLRKNFGETYRHHLADEGLEILVNGRHIKPIDPLWLMEGRWDPDELGRGHVWAEKRYTMDGVLDAVTGRDAEFTYRVAVGPFVDPDTDALRTRVKDVKSSNQGVYIVRDKRQIARAETLGLYAKNNEYNWVRAEIRFPPSLDKFFGVQMNKSRCRLHEDVMARCSEDLRRDMYQARDHVKRERKARTSDLEEGHILPSERRAKEAWGKSARLRREHLSTTDEEAVAAQRRRTDEERAVDGALEAEEQKRRELGNEKPLTPTEEQVIRDAVVHRFSPSQRPLPLAHEHLPGGDLFRVVPESSTAFRVEVNTATPWYERAYAPLIRRDPEAAWAIHSLLYGWGKADLDARHEPEDYKVIQRFLRMLSGFTQEFARDAEAVGGDEEDQ